MHPTRPDSQRCRERGVTLVELVIALGVVAIIVGATIYFVYPLRQATDVTVRATLTDIADNALQRIGRDVRLALPNSVRVDGTSVEFLALRTAGRYRGAGGEGVAPPNCSGGGGGGRSVELRHRRYMLSLYRRVSNRGGSERLPRAEQLRPRFHRPECLRSVWHTPKDQDRGYEREQPRPNTLRN